MMWFMLRPYQRIRISCVLLQSDWIRQRAEKSPALAELLVGGKFDERRWRNTWGFHLVRSKYAVASGGTNGTGYGRGPFVKYNFLPERHNDFIFSVIAHQWGFLGCLGFLFLYVLLIACGLEIAGNNTDPFARLLAVGIVAMFVVEGGDQRRHDARSDADHRPDPAVRQLWRVQSDGEHDGGGIAQ